MPSTRRLLLKLLLLLASPWPLLADDCNAEDTHISCGELVVFNDTRSPASTVFRIALPESLLRSSYTFYASTCHKETTGHTTVKLYDDCPHIDTGRGMSEAEVTATLTAELQGAAASQAPAGAVAAGS